MPTVQGTDDFNHVVDAGYYTDGFFGTPTSESSPIYSSTPRSLRIITDGGNVGVRHNITGTPARGWAGFPFRYTAAVSGASHAVHSFGTTAGHVGAINVGASGLYVSIGGNDGAEFPVSIDTWYWVETILDCSASPLTVYMRVNGVDAATASVVTAATTLTWSQLISFAGDPVGYTTYYGGSWKWGSAASTTDWLGEPPPPSGSATAGRMLLLGAG